MGVPTLRIPALHRTSGELVAGAVLPCVLLLCLALFPSPALAATSQELQAQLGLIEGDDMSLAAEMSEAAEDDK